MIEPRSPSHNAAGIAADAVAEGQSLEFTVSEFEFQIQGGYASGLDLYKRRRRR